MWRKVILLSFYLIVLFVLARFLEVAFWFSGHRYIFTPNSLIDPFSLSVKSLRQLLDSRGISYTTAIEKQDLTSLLVTSGQVTEQELQESEKSEGLSKASPTHQTVHFTGGSHFYEEVEDTKDSVWLVQVVSNENQSPLLDTPTWKQVVSHVSKFGVRTGVFKCSLDRRLCARKSWTSPLLVLALPRGQRTKEDVVLHNYQYSSKPQSVLKWVRQNLSTRVGRIQSEDELRSDWLSLNRTHGETPLRVILLSTLDEPPLFLSALAIKFTGRAQFGMMKVKEKLASSEKDSVQIKNFPSYLIATPEKVYMYGQKGGEILSFKWMELHLKSLHPEVNDIFLVTLFLLNISVGLEFFLVTGKLWRHCVRWLLRLVKCNCLFFLFWLVLLGAHHFQIVHSFTSLCLKLLRLISDNSLTTTVRNDCQYLYSARFFAASFLAFGLSIFFLWKKLGYGNDQDVALFSDWWFVPWDSYLMNYFFRPMASITIPLAPQDMDIEEGLELFIEHLAVPNLWLVPVPAIQIEYLKDLPVWKYSGLCQTDDEWQSQDEKKNYLDVISSSEDECGQSNKDKNKNRQLSCFYSVRELLSKRYRDGERDSATCSKKHKKPGLVQKAGDLRKCLGRFSRKKITKNNQGTTSTSANSHNMKISNTNGNVSNSSSSRIPFGMMECRDCSICLEIYNMGEMICGLPCGHNYHHNCIMLWLTRDNHCCPICRWPSFKPNPKTTQPHLHSQ